MDTEMKTLLFVLFGSVVPASAQEAQGYGGILQTVVVSVSASLTVVVSVLALWWKFDGKIGKLGERIDAAKKELKDDAQTAHAEIGTHIRAVDQDVKDSEKRVTANFNARFDDFNARFDDLRDYIKLGLNLNDKDRP